VKVGDVVKLLTSTGKVVAIVVDEDPSGWLVVVDQDGKQRTWPKQQMKLLESNNYKHKLYEVA
jgi:hypothetical protein